MALSLDGKNFYVPGVYAITKVVNIGGTALPTFNVGVIIAKTKKGKPYTIGTGSTSRTADQFIQPFTNASDLKKEYGIGDMLTFYRYAQKKGAGVVYCLSASPNTKMSGGVIDNNASTPVPAITIGTVGYGAEANDISLTIAASLHTIIPPKNTVFLTVDSGTVKTITVEDVTPYKVGDSVLVNCNSYSTPISHVIESISAALSTITFTAAVAATATVANYARIFQQDTDNQEVSATLDTGAKLLAFYGTSRFLTATIENGITEMPTTVAKTYAQNATSATKATSPDPQTIDWQNVADNFMRWNEEFAIAHKYYMRVIGLAISTSTVHSAFATCATSLRSYNKPLAIVTGCALGDINLASSETAYPAKRALALNSDDVVLAGPGLDGFASYVSFAGELFGIRISNDVKHNITADEVIASSVEKSFYREDITLESLTQAGVVCVVATKTGYKVSQGLTTYQDQTTSFNTSSKKTYLIRNRDIADYKLRTIMDVLETIYGDETITSATMAAICVNAGLKLVELGYITSYKLTDTSKEGNSWTVYDEATIESAIDLIGLVNTIVVN